MYEAASRERSDKSRTPLNYSHLTGVRDTLELKRRKSDFMRDAKRARSAISHALASGKAMQFDAARAALSRRHPPADSSSTLAPAGWSSRLTIFALARAGAVNYK